jgi:tetratricopeptide (TPR) repeat protein
MRTNNTRVSFANIFFLLWVSFPKKIFAMFLFLLLIRAGMMQEAVHFNDDDSLYLDETRQELVESSSAFPVDPDIQIPPSVTVEKYFHEGLDWYDRGKALFLQNDPKNGSSAAKLALKKLKRVIDINPNHAKSYVIIADLLSLLGSASYSEIITIYNKAIDLGLKSSEVVAMTHFKIGMILFETKRFKDAIVRFNQALDCNLPEEHKIIAYHTKGSCYFNLNDLKRSIKQYEKAIKTSSTGSGLYRNHPDLYKNIGHALVQDKRHTVAITHYKKALELEKNNISKAKIHFCLVMAYSFSGGHPEDVKNHFDFAMALNPQYADPYLWRAFSLQGAKHYSEALENYKKAIELQPRHRCSSKKRVEECIELIKKQSNSELTGKFAWFYAKPDSREKKGPLKQASQPMESFVK